MKKPKRETVAQRECRQIEKRWAKENLIEELRKNSHFQKCSEICMLVWGATGRALSSDENAKICELATALSVSARILENQLNIRGEL